MGKKRGLLLLLLLLLHCHRGPCYRHSLSDNKWMNECCTLEQGTGRSHPVSWCCNTIFITPNTHTKGGYVPTLARKWTTIVRSAYLHSNGDEWIPARNPSDKGVWFSDDRIWAATSSSCTPPLPLLRSMTCPTVLQHAVAPPTRPLIYYYYFHIGRGKARTGWFLGRMNAILRWKCMSCRGINSRICHSCCGASYREDEMCN